MGPRGLRGAARGRTRKRSGQKSLLGTILGGITIAGIGAWLLANVVAPAAKELATAATGALFQEELDLPLSTQEYDIQTGGIGQPAPLDAPVRGSLDRVRQQLSEQTANQITERIKGELSLDATFELSSFDLRSSVPLNLLVAERTAAQVRPAVHPLGPDGQDLTNFFKTGSFFDATCRCINVTFRDSHGRLSGGPDQIYLTDGGPSFQAQEMETRVTRKLTRGSIIVAVMLDVKGASADFDERAKAAAYAALTEGLRRDPVIKVAPYQTLEEFEALRKQADEIPPGPEKSVRIEDIRVDALVMGTAIVDRKLKIPGQG